MQEVSLLGVGAILIVLLAIFLRRGKAAPQRSPEPSGSPGPALNKPESTIQYVINNPAGDGTVPAALLPWKGGYSVQVVGESHYQDVLRALTGISILAVPVGTSYTPNVFRVGRMCSWPMLQAPDTVSEVHIAVELTGSRLVLGHFSDTSPCLCSFFVRPAP